ncbi:hypothetical protein FPK45_21385, partial [Acinetobacter baumannii]|uniref:hypothetical protein n=1 Tax=Acinetobacter baumannii TaxID=470 RepID=UPI00288CC613
NTHCRVRPSGAERVLRSQLGSGPLALLALRGLPLPEKIFTVDAAESAQALTTGVGNSEMDEMEL